MATSNATGRQYYLKEQLIQLIEDSLSPEQKLCRLAHLIAEICRLELQRHRHNHDRLILARVMDELRKRERQLKKLLKPQTSRVCTLAP
jgi:hypothetical protein